MLGALPTQMAIKPAFHAHNDYLHSRPLLDALDQGFDSVEADVFLVKNELLVGHFFWETKPERTLESLYLVPLSKLHKEGKLKNIWLMVDIKTNEAEPSAILLDQQLRRYPGLFSKVGEKDNAPVKVLLSGNMPREWVCSGKSNLLRLDGREADLGKAEQAGIFPWVSEPWSKHFSWKGKGPISESEKICHGKCINKGTFFFCAHTQADKILILNAGTQCFYIVADINRVLQLKIGPSVYINLVSPARK